MYAIRSYYEQCVNACDRRKDSADNKPADGSGVIPKFLYKRVNAILRAEVVILIHAAVEVCIIVENVVCSMGDA